MEHTEHVLIVDPDVAFLERYGLEVVERDHFITEPRKQQLDHMMDGRAIASRHGTVGAVAAMPAASPPPRPPAGWPARPRGASETPPSSAQAYTPATTS